MNKRIQRKALDHLLKDPELEKYLEGENAQANKEVLSDYVKQAAQPYGEHYSNWKTRLFTGASKVMRYASLGANIAGDMLFHTYGGMGFKGLAFLGNTAADVIDAGVVTSARPEVKFSDVMKLGGESLVERVAAYFPVFGTSVIDHVRGRDKFDSLIYKSIRNEAKRDFMKYQQDHSPYGSNPYLHMDDPVIGKIGSNTSQRAAA